MRRTVLPELLDSLSHDAPAAVASRRDLRFINRLMGNFVWFAHNLRLIPCTHHITELGAGDGGLGLYLNSHDASANIAAYTGVDLIPRPTDWPAIWKWQQRDLLSADFEDSTTLLANLILHHFSDDDLAAIGARIAASDIRIILINEPARRRLHLWQMIMARLLRFHPVTYHDAQTSIRAGFRRDEIAHLLRIDGKGWTFAYSEAILGANRLIAQRK